MKDERNFDDFEQFLKDEADNQKMFPSDHVWNNISNTIQPKRSWPALSIISIVVVLSLGITTFLNYPPENPFRKVQMLTKSNISSYVNAKRGLTYTTNKSLIITSIVDAIKTSKKQVLKDGLTNNTSPLSFKELFSEVPANKSESIEEDKAIVTSSKAFEQGVLSETNLQSKLGLNSFVNKGLSSANSAFHKEKSNLKGKIEYEIYATPSVSYRTLAEDKFTNQSSSNSASVNNLVNQKAGLGTEFGFGLRFKTSNSLTFKTGLQFNVRQYYINAYRAPGLATIEVLQDNKFDSIDVVSKYGNSSNGSVSQTRLNNSLYQISIPIGLEWNAIDRKKWGLSFNASIQPTYSLNKNVYILSTDYKYYANGESLFRKWNVNSSIGASLSYKLKKSTIYLGPEVRYQHLPTYVDKYPIKEYRIDYGMRIGIIKSIK